ATPAVAGRTLPLGLLRAVCGACPNLELVGVGRGNLHLERQHVVRNAIVVANPIRKVVGLASRLLTTDLSPIDGCDGRLRLRESFARERKQRERASAHAEQRTEALVEKRDHEDGGLAAALAGAVPAQKRGILMLSYIEIRREGEGQSARFFSEIGRASCRGGVRLPVGM